MTLCTTNERTLPQSPSGAKEEQPQQKPSEKQLALMAFAEADHERFWSKVEKKSHPKGCWEWTASSSNKGYGFFGIGGFNFLSHRVSFFITNGTLPHGLVIRHSCDNPKCFNPAHLRPGTMQDNHTDMHSRGRYGRKGRPYKNGRYVYGKSNGSWDVRVCRKYIGNYATKQEAEAVAKQTKRDLLAAHKRIT